MRCQIKGKKSSHPGGRLHHYGIQGGLLDWIQHYVLLRSQCVKVEGQQSDLSMVTFSVPQGTVVAPLLFLYFINDLPDGISSKVKLYICW